MNKAFLMHGRSAEAMGGESNRQSFESNDGRIRTARKE